MQELFQVLSDEVGAKAIHVIAYSMGARTLMEALRNLGPSDSFARSDITSHIYFMAPDVAAHIFAKLVSELKFLPRRKQEYVLMQQQKQEEEEEEKERTKEGDRRYASDGATWPSDYAPVSVSSPSEIAHDIVDRLGDAWSGLIGDSVSAWDAIRSAWKHARPNLWEEFLKYIHDPQDDMVGETSSRGGEAAGRAEVRDAMALGLDLERASLSAAAGAEADTRAAAGAAGVLRTRAAAGSDQVVDGLKDRFRGLRRNAHIHLFVAQNDIALLISELSDRGIPQVRAGRRTKDMLLCNSDMFSTIDASSLKTGLMTTGHFYLFHRIVRQDMQHMLNGGGGLPWWRQGAEWNKQSYVKLRNAEPRSQVEVRREQRIVMELRRETEAVLGVGLVSCA